MSMIRVLNAVATAVAGTVGWSEAANPAADPEAVAAMLGEVGIRAGSGELDSAVRRFQARARSRDRRCRRSAGRIAPGSAGPETVHALARAAAEHRHLREIGLAA